MTEPEVAAATVEDSQKKNTEKKDFQPASTFDPTEQTSRPKLTRPGSRMETGDSIPVTEFYRPNPLDGDRIMDATARLLAPRRSSTTAKNSAVSSSKIAKSEKKSRPQKSVPASSPVLPGETAQIEKSGQPHKNRKKSKARNSVVQPEKKPISGKKERSPIRAQKSSVDAGRPGHTKDSTEQQSLMKPYYLSF